MPDVSVTTIIILAVTRRHPMHYPPDWVELPLDKQVDVIGHQPYAYTKNEFCKKAEAVKL